MCIITLASVPVLTKKKRKMSDAPHGQWTCEYNEAGKHISYSQDAPTPVEGDYCEFVPPARATNFTIQAVGGAAAEEMTNAAVQGHTAAEAVLLFILNLHRNIIFPIQ